MTGTSKDWPITRAELLGVHELSRNQAIFVVSAGVAVLLLVIGSIGSFLWSVFSEHSKAVSWWSLLPVLSPGFAIPVMMGYPIWNARWKRTAARIWDADGCICPWCKEDVRSHPCSRHGVGPEHRDLLVDHYSYKVLREQQEDGPRLVEAVPRPPKLEVARFGLQTWVRGRHRELTDRKVSRTRRWKVALKFAAIYYLGSALVFAVLLLVLPGLIPHPRAPFGLIFPFWLCMPAYLMALNAKLDFQRVCKSCGQQCPDLEQITCAECGTDLRVAGSIKRAIVNKRRIVVQIAIVGAIFFLSYPLLQLTTNNLPGDIRRALWARTGTPQGYFIDLIDGSLSSDDFAAEADLLLHLARPGGPEPWSTYEWGFIDHGLAFEVIPETYREIAARATVSASMHHETSANGDVIVIVPELTRSLLGDEGPQLLFGGVSIDGGPWSPGSSRSIAHHELAPDETPMNFRVPVDLPPGLHEIEARCWIVAAGPYESSLDPLVLEFDAEGHPIFPEEVVVYDLPITTTVETR